MPNDTSPSPSIRQSLRDLFRGDNLKEILHNWRWVLTFTRRHWLGVAGLTLLGLLSSSLNLAAAIITKNLIGSIIALDMDRLVPMAVLMVLSAALGVAFQSAASRYSARLSTTMHQEIQKLTFDRVVHGDWMAVRRYPTGDLLSRFSGDIGTIAGCYVTSGKVSRNCLIRVVRDGIVIAEDKIDSLRRFKDDVKEVAQGYECGIGLEKFSDIKTGDVFEAYIMEEYRD